VLFKGNAVAPIDHTLYGTLESERLHVGNCTGNCKWGILCESERGKLYVGNCMWDIESGNLYEGNCLWDIVWELVYVNVAEGFKKGRFKGLFWGNAA